MTEKLLLTAREAGESLGLSRSTVYVLLGSGALHSVRIGGARRIPLETLRRYVRSLPAAAEPRGVPADDRS